MLQGEAADSFVSPFIVFNVMTNSQFNNIEYINIIIQTLQHDMSHFLIHKIFNAI